MDTIDTTDIGNAQRLISESGHLIRYDQATRRWYTWNGQSWTSGDGAVTELAKEALARLLHEGTHATDRTVTFDQARWALKSMSASRIRAMVQLASSDPAIAVTASEFDAAVHLLNTPSGIVDLRTGALLPHDPALLQSSITAVPYDPMARCPMWEEGLLRAMGGDQDVVDYLQRAFGYALTAEGIEQAFFLFIGLANSGKSTTLTAIDRILGTYARVATAPTFTYSPFARSGPEPELHKLHGARFVSTSEIDSSARLNEARLRSLTGNEDTMSRTLYKEAVEQRPTFKLFLAANAGPQIRENHDGTWRRVHLVRWDAPLDPADVDKRFEERLRAEYVGILAWLVRGAIAWYRDGLRPPKQVLDWVAEYRAEQDVIGAFLAEMTVYDPRGRVQARPFYEAYKRWFSGPPESLMSEKAFGTDMGNRLVKRRNSEGEAVYWGRVLLQS